MYVTIAALAIRRDGSLLIASSHGLIAVSPDLASSTPIPGSPAPLLGLDITTTGVVLAIQQGGALWRYGPAP